MLDDRQRRKIADKLLKKSVIAQKQQNFKYKGKSMHPLLSEGDNILVEKRTPLELCFGDIIIYRRTHEFIVHRFMYRRMKDNRVFRIIAKADSYRVMDDPFRPRQLIGKVVAIEKNGKSIPRDNKIFNTISFIIAIFSFSQGLFFEGIRQIKEAYSKREMIKCAIKQEITKAIKDLKETVIMTAYYLDCCICFSERILDFNGIRLSVRSRGPKIVKELTHFLEMGGCKKVPGRRRSVMFSFHKTRNLNMVKRELLNKAQVLSSTDTPRYKREWSIFGRDFIFCYELDKVVWLFNADKNIVRGWIPDYHIGENPRFLNIIFMDVFYFIMRFYGILFVHAAGVSKDGKGVLITGSSHAGKSVITLQLLQNGFKFLSDDQVGIGGHKDRKEMIFAPEWMGLTLDTGELFSNLKKSIKTSGVTVDVFYDKIKIPIDELLANTKVNSADPRVMIFLEKSDQDVLDVSKKPKIDAMFELVKDDVLIFDRKAFPGVSRRLFDLLWSLFEQIDVYKLTYSINRLPEITPLIEQLLKNRTAGR